VFSRFFRKSPPPSAFPLRTDMHSHILPGIDDGAPDLETALRLIRGLHAIGYTRLIATPHIYQELYPNTPETIQNALQMTRAALAAEQIPVAIEAAAEYMMDDTFGERIEREKLLTFGQDEVLVEMMALAPPPTLDEYLFRLQTKAYTPVIAHPERYLFWKDRKNKFHELHERGCILQINLLSLTGYYGPSVRQTALYLLKHHLVGYIGTDLHHDKHLALLQKAAADPDIREKVQRVLEQGAS
jgi:tyrosine-protein phosphatase YwqE